MHRRLETKDHVAHQVIDGGKHQVARVLLLGGALIPQIELVGSSHPLQRAPNHDRDRTFFDKPLKHFTEHGGLLSGVRLIRRFLEKILPHSIPSPLDGGGRGWG